MYALHCTADAKSYGQAGSRHTTHLLPVLYSVHVTAVLEINVRNHVQRCPLLKSSVIPQYNLHDLTLSLALISAPLSSRATMVSVWPFFDEM